MVVIESSIGKDGVHHTSLKACFGGDDVTGDDVRKSEKERDDPDGQGNEDGPLLAEPQKRLYGHHNGHEAVSRKSGESEDGNALG